MFWVVLNKYLIWFFFYNEIFNNVVYIVIDKYWLLNNDKL